MRDTKEANTVEEYCKEINVKRNQGINLYPVTCEFYLTTPQEIKKEELKDSPIILSKLYNFKIKPIFYDWGGHVGFVFADLYIGIVGSEMIRKSTNKYDYENKIINENQLYPHYEIELKNQVVYTYNMKNPSILSKYGNILYKIFTKNQPVLELSQKDSKCLKTHIDTIYKNAYDFLPQLTKEWHVKYLIEMQKIADNKLSKSKKN